MKYAPLQLKYQYGLDLVEKYCPPNCGGGKSVPGHHSVMAKVKEIETSIAKESVEHLIIVDSKTGNILARTKGTEGAVDSADDIMRQKWNGNIMTHNHPGHPQMFSWRDVESGARYNASEVRMVCHDKEHGICSFSVKPDGGKWNKKFLEADWLQESSLAGKDLRTLKGVNGNLLRKVMKGELSEETFDKHSSFQMWQGLGKKFGFSVNQDRGKPWLISDENFSYWGTELFEPLQATEDEAVSCQTCIHFDGHYACPAYPNGVPMSLYLGVKKHDHVLGCQDGELTWESKQALEMDIVDFLNLVPAQAKFGGWTVEAYCPPHCGHPGGKNKEKWTEYNKETEKLHSISPEQLMSMDNHVKSYGREQEKTFDHYMGSGYSKLNRELRSKSLSEDNKSIVSILDKSISGFKTGEDIVVYRGFAIPGLLEKKSLEGSIFTDHGYVSTSVLPKQARRFATAQDKDYAVIARIHIPKGSNVGIPAPMTWRNKINDEGEILLPRGSKFRVVSFTEKNGKDDPHLMVLEVVK